MAHQITRSVLTAKQNRGEVSPSKEIIKLRIQLSDKIFQLRKLDEDYAEKKAHLMLQFNQQKTQLNTTIRELRAIIQQENEHWTNKVDQIRKENQQLLYENNETWLGKIQFQVNQQTCDIKAQYESKITELKKCNLQLNETIKENKKLYEKTISEIKDECSGIVNQIKVSKQLEIEEIKKKMMEDEQMKINAIMDIKKSEEKQLFNTKNILAKKQTDHEAKLKNAQARIYELKQQTWNLKKQNENLERKIEEQIEHIQKLEESKQNSIKLTTKQYQQKSQKIQETWKETIKKLNQKWMVQHKKIQLAYEKAINTCNEKEMMWKQRGEKVLDLYERREAREEDVKMIEQLEVQLIRKEFELERERQQLKSCKLQLGNMDDIYKRIFNSMQRNTRNSHSFHLKKVKLPGIMNRSTNPVKPTGFYFNV